jgi:uncharacterized protein
MARPPKPRVVCRGPAATYFKPRGVPLACLEETVLGLDELETLRLVDLERLSHEDAGARMGVSRGTIGRLLERAHRKVVDALLTAKALRLEGGPIQKLPHAPLEASASDAGEREPAGSSGCAEGQPLEGHPIPNDGEPT